MARADGGAASTLVGRREPHAAADAAPRRAPPARHRAARRRARRCWWWARPVPSGAASWCGAAPAAPTWCWWWTCRPAWTRATCAPSRLEEARREALGGARPAGGQPGGGGGVRRRRGPAVPAHARSGGGAPRRSSRSSSGAVSEPGTDLGRALRHGGAGAARRDGARSRRSCCGPTARISSSGARAAIDELARERACACSRSASARRPATWCRCSTGRAHGRRQARRERRRGAQPARRESAARRWRARTRGGYFSASRPGGELPRLLASLGVAGALEARSAAGRAAGRALPAVRGAGRCCCSHSIACERDDADRARGGRSSRAEADRPRRGRVRAARRGCWWRSRCCPPCRARTRRARGRAATRVQGRTTGRDAESLYALRRGGTGARRAGQPRHGARTAAGRATRPRPSSARCRRATMRAGRAAGYNLGTLLAQRAASTIRRSTELRRDARARSRGRRRALELRAGAEASRGALGQPAAIAPATAAEAPGGGGGGAPQPTPGAPPPTAPPPGPSGTHARPRRAPARG